MTTSETFLWYRPHPRLSLGLAHLLKQNAVRYLASVVLIPEAKGLPALNASAGVQGIGTGNPGYSATLEKNWPTRAGKLNMYAGVGFRSNENHVHPIGGIKFGFNGGLTVGVQDDGHQRNPFATVSSGSVSVGLYLVQSKKLAYVFGVRF